jgi:predicted TIM-barrel fold metal-dependent hydrolase
MQQSLARTWGARLAIFGIALSSAAFVRLLPAGTPRSPFAPAAAQAQKPSGQGQAVAALSPYIDVHAHLDPADPDASIWMALESMPQQNLAKIVFMPSPMSPQDVGRFDVELILPAAKKYPGRVAVLGGGGTLNPMILEAVRTGDASPELQMKFKERAEAILGRGAVGFGEMSAEHFPSTTPYQYAPPDHPLFLLLADVAGRHDVPISLHMEAVPQDMDLPAPLKSPPNPPRLHANIPAFERLLAHNPRAKIVWAHLGWDNTGYRTPDLCRRLLRAHPNLYMEIKLDPIETGKTSPLADGATGKIKPEWLKLFSDFPNRFVMGTDQHYPMPQSGPLRWQADVLLFNQLSPDVRRKIGTENAIRIYHLE